MKTFFQTVKFLLVGGIATLADLAVFDIVMFVLSPNPLVAKSISFLVSTAMKYGGNKYWTFEKTETEKIHLEIFQFIIVTVVALVIDLGTFYYATKTLGPQFGFSPFMWREVSVVLAALSSAVVSFLGYKLLVFKK